MNITYLVGNGFDISLGAGTSYYDFYQHLITTHMEDLKNNSIFKEIVNDKVNLWSDFEMALAAMTFELDQDGVSTFLSDLNTILNNLHEYLITQELAELIDINYLATEWKNTTFNFLDELRPLEKNTILDRIRNQTSSVIKINVLSFNYTRFLRQAFEGLDRFMYDIKNVYNNQMYCIPSKFIHMHSKLHDGIVVGQDNKSQINSEIFTDRQLNVLIKPMANDYVIKSDSNTISKSVIKNSSIVVVYGMSYGESDLTWWNLIRQWLNSSKDRILILCEYDGEETPFNPSSMSFGLKKEQAIDNFFSNLSIDKIDKYDNQIYVIHNSKKILNFKNNGGSENKLA